MTSELIPIEASRYYRYNDNSRKESLSDDVLIYTHLYVRVYQVREKDWLGRERRGKGMSTTCARSGLTILDPLTPKVCKARIHISWMEWLMNVYPSVSQSAEVSATSRRWVFRYACVGRPTQLNSVSVNASNISGFNSFVHRDKFCFLSFSGKVK